MQDVATVPVSRTACYENGVKIENTGTASTGPTEVSTTSTFRVKNASGLCYTRTLVTHNPLVADAGISFGVDITMQDSSGTTLMTAHQDVNDVVTVTCPGRPPTAFVESCGFSIQAARGAYLIQGIPPPTCTDGPCSF